MIPLLLFACGLKTNVTKDGRSPHDPEPPTPKKSGFKLSGPLMEYSEGTASNSRTHSFKAEFIPGEETPREDPQNPLALIPKVKVTVANEQGVIQWEKSQQLKETQWDVPMSQSGLRTIIVESQDLDGKIETILKKKVDADFDPPKILLTSLIESRMENGERPLLVSATIQGEKSSSCEKAEVRLLGETQTVKVELAPKTQEQDVEGTTFQGQILLKEQNLRSTPLVTVTCKDRAGNSQEVREPASSKPSVFKLYVEPTGPTVPMTLQEMSVMVTYLKSPELELALTLTDPVQGKPLAESLVAAIKDEFVIHVTDKAPESLEDLGQNKNIIWTQNLERQITVKLPHQLLDLQLLYLTLVHKDPVVGQDILVSTTRIPVFIDKFAPKITLDTGLKLRKVALDSPIELKAKLEVEGAPLRPDGLQVELTLDGQTWNTVPATVTGDPKNKILAFKYPFANEVSLRARIKATDLTGNSAYSEISPLLVGLDPKTLDVPTSEREQCQTDGSSGSVTKGALLKPWLVSKFLCRKDNGAGGLSPTPYAVLVFQNRGQIAPNFYQSASVKAGLGYKVLLDGNVVFESRLESAPQFTLGPSDYLVYHIPIQMGWREGSLLELRTDLEASGANSTTNGCYGLDKPYGSVVLMDKAQNINLDLDAFACSTDGPLVL